MINYIRSNKKQIILYGLAMLSFVAIPFIMYFSYIKDGLLPVSGDGVYSLYSRLSAARTFWDNGIAFWSPNMEAGTPYGSYAHGILSPFLLICSMFPAEQYYYVYYFGHLILGTAFMFFFLRELKHHPFAAYVVSVIFETSVQLNGIRKEHSEIIIAITFVPVILFFMQRYINKKGLGWLVLSAFAMGIQFMEAQTQCVLYFDIAVFVYLVLYLLKDRTKIRTAVCHISAWLVTYIGYGAFDLIANARVLAQYDKISSASTDYMSAYSVHFVMLLKAFFPNFYEDTYKTYTYVNSSGFDIELYLGLFVAACAIYAVIRLRSNFNVKVSIAFCCIAFVFAAMGHIPFVVDIVKHVPIISNFRVPSRALFIAIFFALVLASHTLSELFEERSRDDFLIYLRRFSLVMVVVSAMIYLGGVVASEINVFQLSDDASQADILERCDQMVTPTLWLSIAAIPVTFLFQKVQLKKLSDASRVKSVALCSCLLVTTLAEVYPFSSAANSVSLSILDPSRDQIREMISEDQYYKVLDANSNSSKISYNMSGNGNAYFGISGINAYRAYNNPTVFRALTGMPINANASGVFLTFSNIDKILTQKNELLSILGVKYINDTDGIMDGLRYMDKSAALQEESVKFEQNDLVIPATGDVNTYASFTSDSISLNKNTGYCIEITARCETVPYFFYVDLYTPEYDNAEQQVDSKFADGVWSVRTVINSGDSPEQAVLRLVGSSDSDIYVDQIKLTTCNIKYSTYQYFAERGNIPTDSNKVYINPNAKSVLFSTDYVQKLDDELDYFYSNPSEYRMLDCTYVSGDVEEMDLTQSDTRITDIDFNADNISATVTASTDTFINFSQSYDSGWSAYVDGARTEVYMTDGVIMGITVPEGSHVIEFRYRPASLIAGLCITILTAVFWAAFYIVKAVRKKRRVDHLTGR